MSHLINVSDSNWAFLTEIAYENGFTPEEFASNIIATELDGWRDYLHYQRIQEQQDNVAMVMEKQVEEVMT